MTSKESKLLQYVLSNSEPNNPTSVLAAMDTFGYDHEWHMSVGEVKGQIVEGYIKKFEPKIMVEVSLVLILCVQHASSS
jgi:catechol O-methyltransferase